MYQEHAPKKYVTVIIPAFNEYLTIGNLIAIVRTHPFVSQVIVVDDGSTDHTSDVAESAGAFVIRHAYNYGKAKALDTGVSHVATDILFFIDADVTGLTHEIMTHAIYSVSSRITDMYVLIVDRGRWVPPGLNNCLPLLSGIRVLRRRIWDAVPETYKSHFQIELALNYFAYRSHAAIETRVVVGLHHVIKEKKRGVMWGMYQRIFMIRDIVWVLLRLYILQKRGRIPNTHITNDIKTYGE